MVRIENLFRYRCHLCGNEYDPSPEILVCHSCHAVQDPKEPLRGVLEVCWDYPTLRQRIEAQGGHWDVLDLLPVEREFFPPIPVGNTPLWKPFGLWKRLGVEGLYLKDDGANPTGSLKDRASFLVAAFAKKVGRSIVAVASTGNAASSMAGVGAAAGLKVQIFMPKSAPIAKRVQSLLYGADVTLVEGTYDDAYDASLEYCSSHREVLSRNTAQQPLTIEGKKTVALEIYRDLGGPPKRVYVSVGDGVILAGVYRGFEDLLRLGIIGQMPEIVGVQAEGSSAIARAFKRGSFEGGIQTHTVADSISVEIPRNGYLAIEKLKRYNGRVILVSDGEILEAQKKLASWTGLFSEPAGAAAFAGYLKDVLGTKASTYHETLERELVEEEPVVVLLTGNGLKDVESALKALSSKHP
ncbi:MAG: pyridoxal-phosphate dependent enzyme [Spirochaetes bacterium]|nr:pyridoxal-phosphate dependent enzyme [Spirochaetota bacterium]